MNRQEQNHHLLTRASALLFELDLEGTVLAVNDAIYPLTGYSAGELVGQNWWEVLLPGTQQAQVEPLLEAWRLGDVLNYELNLTGKGGQVLTIELSSANQYDADGSLLKIIGIGLDITQRKQTEERYRLLVESVKDYAIFTLDPNGIVTSWNSGAQRIKGYQAEEIIGRHFSQFYLPEFLQAGMPQKNLEQAASKGRLEVEDWRVRKDGTRFWANIVYTALRDQHGRLLGFSKVVRDITWRKQADEALQRQTSFLRLLHDVAVASNEATSVSEALQYAMERICDQGDWQVGHALVLAMDAQNGLVSMNLPCVFADDASQDFHKASRELRFQHDQDLPGIVLKTKEPGWIESIDELSTFMRPEEAKHAGLITGMAFPVLVGEKVVAVLEFYSRKKQAMDEQVMNVMAQIGTQLGRVVEREQSEKALRHSEARFRTIFNEAAVGIELVDLDGHLLEANPALKRFMGHEVLDKSSRLREAGRASSLLAENELLSDLLAGTIDTYKFEKSFTRADGKVVWGRLSASLARDQDGRPQFIISMLDDITESKEMEADLAELKYRQIEGREMERVMLAKELHDGPVQDLYGLSFQLKAFEGDLPAGIDESPLGEFQTGLRSVVRTLQSICSELRPPTLGPLGLEKAIRSHVDVLQARQTELSFRLELMPDGRSLPEHLRLALFRIYQEAISNVVRHAQARNVRVRLLVDPSSIILEIQDDGRGFEVPDRWINLAREGHMGLAAAVERAEALGGRLEITSLRDEGTTLKAVIPYKDDIIDQ